MTHISKELAIWLQGQGAHHIEAAYVYDGNKSNPNFRTLKDLMEEVVQKEAVKQGSGGGWFCFAYSWYDILVTHAKEFWGKEKLCDDCGEMLVPDYKLIGAYGPVERFECDCGFKVDPNEIPAWLHRPRIVLCYLLDNDTIGAEDYVKTHSLFAKQDL